MVIRRCVPETEQGKILDECHESSYGGHFVGDRTTYKILQSSFYWPTLFRDCFEWVKHCDKCQRMGNISRRNEMPLQRMMVVHILMYGDRLHGTFPILILKFIHSPSCGLCIQMGGSNSLS